MSDDRTPVLDDDPRPIVRLPPPGLSGLAIASIAGVVAVGLFVTIEQGRSARASAPVPAAAAGAFAPVPPLAVPPEPAAPPPPATVAVAVAPSPPAPPPAPPVIVQPTVLPPRPVEVAPVVRQSPARPAAPEGPALVVDGGVEQSAVPQRGGAQTATPGSAAAAAAVDDTPVRAALLANSTTIMPTGTIMAAVLETPIDTARPGLARALVAEDARGFDGTRVLVPRGSRLIGEFQSDVRPGQNRVLVTWSRLIRPDGVTIRLASPAADALGGAGVPGRVHSYFFERFASAVLQSALAVGVNLASRNGNGSVIIEGSGQGLNSVVGQQLLPGADLKPKITIRQGAAIDVFVAHDLDFSGVPALKRRGGA